MGTRHRGEIAVILMVLVAFLGGHEVHVFLLTSFERTFLHLMRRQNLVD
jgi:hypothetical protein